MTDDDLVRDAVAVATAFVWYGPDTVRELVDDLRSKYGGQITPLLHGQLAVIIALMERLLEAGVSPTEALQDIAAQGARHGS